MIRAMPLCRDARGLAMMEFALSLPLVMTILLYGTELANYAIVREQVSQLAAQVADNGSRIGNQEVLRNKPISEKMINDLLIGARLQAGGLQIQDRGRIIVSSLELNSSNGQWLHWQRCSGALAYPSSYGVQGDGTSGTAFPGMGPATSRITASKGNPVIFVELAYTYRPLIAPVLAPQGLIKEVAAMSVRDDRDTTQVYNDEHVAPSTC